MPQAARPHGSGLPCVAPRVASHEAVPLVDKGAEVIPNCTSHLPYHGVARLLSTPITMAGPSFSSERGKNMCDSPSPYVHDGRISNGLVSGLRRQTGKRGMDRRVPLLAHKLPGTQGCLPGFDVFSPRPRGASYHSQDNMTEVSHINRQGGSRSRTLDRLVRRLLLGPSTSSCPWGQFTFRGYWTSWPTFCQDRNSGWENGCWTIRQYPRFGICLAKRKWTSLLLKNHPSARSGSPWVPRRLWA